MNKITEPLKRYLKAQDCVFEFDREKRTLHFGISGANARWRCLSCEDDTNRFVLVSLIPLAVPEQKRTACAELIVRINARLGLGRFDLDFSDGELCYVTNIPLCDKANLSADIIAHVIRGHQTLVDSFIPALAALLFAGMTPEKAVELDTQKVTEPALPRFSLN